MMKKPSLWVMSRNTFHRPLTKCSSQTQHNIFNSSTAQLTPQLPEINKQIIHRQLFVFLIRLGFCIFIDLFSPYIIPLNLALSHRSTILILHISAKCPTVLCKSLSKTLKAKMPLREADCPTISCSGPFYPLAPPDLKVPGSSSAHHIQVWRDKRTDS